MNKSSQNDSISGKLRAYKRKYYKNLMLRGSIISFVSLASFFLLANSLEFALRFSSVIRGTILLSFIALTVFTLIKYVFDPLSKLVDDQKGITDEEAAKQIGRYFPNVNDRLLNLLQLEHMGTDGNTLVSAGINQKSREIIFVPFIEAINLKENLKYVKYIIPLLLVILCIGLWKPEIFATGTKRIVQFNKEFAPEAPFIFGLDNNELQAFRNEDFTVKASLTGAAVPESLYLIQNGRRVKMQKQATGKFSYTFQKIQSNKSFQFEAAGFTSQTYKIRTVERPNIKNFNISLEFPKYVQKKNERLANVGNLEIPEGTNVKWQFSTLNAKTMEIGFLNTGNTYNLNQSDEKIFEFKKQILKNEAYQIKLSNDFSDNRDKIVYNINVIPDKFPKITLDVYQDTTLYSFLVLGGNISDDYGLNKLKLYYKISDGKQSDKGYASIDIPVDRKQNNQRFYYQWMIDSLNIGEGEEISYFLQVWDNDGINGSKSTKTGFYNFKIPTKQKIKEDLKTSSQNAEKKIDKTIEKAKEIKESIEEVEKKLKGKKELNWQDENLLKDIIKKREELNKAIEELKEQNKNNTLKRERFTKQDERIQEKVEQLQKLMDELLDEETKKLYDELKKLLEDKQDIEEVQDILDELENKEDNLEKELERTLELFKRMKFDYKLEENINKLEEMAKEQEKLSEETKEKSNKNDELLEKQENLQEDFEEFKESMEELQELNQEMESPEALPDNSGEEEEVERNKKIVKNP